MIAGINESKTLAKQVLCECKCKFDGRKWNLNSNQKLNNDKCQCECKHLKEDHVSKKDYIWNPATCSCKSGKFLASFTDDSAITCDETIKETKTIPTNLTEKSNL